MPEYIIEIKRHLNKPDQSFRCEVLRRDPDHLTLRYVSDRPGRVGEEVFAPGSVTYAHYWAGRGYVAWRMHGPDGQLRGHVFHICRDVRIGLETVDYLDMLLDLWVSPGGKVTALDEDEVLDCAAQGLLNGQDLAWIEAQRERVLEHLGTILVEIA